eukprot:scaffold1146_cov399-Prasinococcus_capsulatus_cf.AAC.9
MIPALSILSSVTLVIVENTHFPSHFFPLLLFFPLSLARLAVAGAPAVVVEGALDCMIGAATQSPTLPFNVVMA